MDLILKIYHIKSLKGDDKWWLNFPNIQGKMMKTGSMMISYQPLGDLPNFFRSIISNQAQTEEDIDFMLAELDRLGHDL